MAGGGLTDVHVYSSGVGSLNSAWCVIVCRRKETLKNASTPDAAWWVAGGRTAACDLAGD